MRMGQQFHASSGNGTFSPERMRKFLAGILDAGVIFITDDGFLAGLAAPELSSDWIVAHEVLWWSEGRCGAKLRKAFEAWASETGCDEVQFSHPAANATVGAILERAGYEPATKVWRKPCA